MYSPQDISKGPRVNSPRSSPEPVVSSPAEEPRTTADDWTEEANRQAHALDTAVPRSAENGIFAEFRRKLAVGEAVSRAVARLAEALRFSGRIVVTFHQGKVTKTVLEELYIRGVTARRAAP